MSLKIFIYENSSISFNDGENLIVNATEMAKAFGKLPADYLRLSTTKEFLAAYMEANPVMGNPITVVQGGKGQGTWMHEDIALDFAQWLSPRFRVWVNARIKELVRHGVTATPEMLLNPDMMIEAMNQLKEARAEAELKGQQLQLANKTIDLQAPKVEYYNQVLQIHKPAHNEFRCCGYGYERNQAQPDADSQQNHLQPERGLHALRGLSRQRAG